MAMSLYEKTIAMLALAMVVSHVANALKCRELTAPLDPCATFLSGAGPDRIPDSECCVGLYKVSSDLATTVKLRRTLCQCFKEPPFADIDLSRGQKLPAYCDTPVSFEISPNVDCSKIQ